MAQNRKKEIRKKKKKYKLKIKVMESSVFCDKRFQKELFKVLVEELNLDEREAAERILKWYKEEVRAAVVKRLETVISRVKGGCTDMTIVSGKNIKFKDCCGLKDLVSIYEVLGMWPEKFLKELKDEKDM